jgi:hypothetical protein
VRFNPYWHREKLTVRCIQDSDIERLVHENTLRNVGSRIRGNVQDLIRLSAQNPYAHSHGAFFRYIGNGIVAGHVGAQLISNFAAREIMRSWDERLIFDPIVSPLANEEIRQNNLTLEGSTLLITSLILNTVDEHLTMYFLVTAMEHIVRWFEGNRITQLLVAYPTRWVGWWRGRHPFEVLLEMMGADCSPASVLSSGITMRTMNGGNHGVLGHSTDWGARLFEIFRSPVQSIREKRKLQSRILHEFNFNIEQAVNCIPTWSLTFDDPPKCSSVRKWMGDVASDLDINQKNRSHGYPTMAEVREKLAANPGLMALY